ncbi:MAG TPA: hypothetical protein VKU41_27645 [Polyangiaceae bacterium]|nr:hypothetical protein [Polyangiaceae bacterium]
MGLRASGVVVVSVITGVWVANATEREKPLLGGPASREVSALEAHFAARPGDAEAARALEQGYVDAHQPGLALALFDAASPAIRGDVRLRHAYGRALVDEGRSDEALAVEEEIVGTCSPVVEGSPAPAGCDSVLLASAVRRAGILLELVRLGVTDAQAHPEASLVAYRNATREARVTLQ